MDYEFARAMRDAGCVEMSFGIESFDDNVLKILKKGTTVKDNVLALEAAEKAGVSCRVLFMIRTPGQTEHTVKENIKWLDKETVQYSVFENSDPQTISAQDDFRILLEERTIVVDF